MVRCLHISEGDMGKRTLFSRIPLFWQYLAAMALNILLALVVSLLISQHYQNTLSNELQEKFQSNLEKNSGTLDNIMYATVNVPGIIEKTRHFEYLNGQRKTDLDQKYQPVLSMLREDLKQQVYLTSGAVDTFLYLRRGNSLIGTDKYEAVAENYFKSNLIFEKTDAATVLHALREGSTSAFLSMQRIKLNGNDAGDCLTLIMHTQNSSMSIMSIYTRAMIEKTIALDDLPDGTLWEIEDGNGLVLARSFENSGEKMKTVVLQGRCESFGLTVRLFIPSQYFTDLMKTSKGFGFVSIATMAILGFIISIILSKALVLPIRKITDSQRSHARRSSNELDQLEQIFIANQEDMRQMRRELISQLTAKAFYGGFLSKEEEQLLAESAQKLFSSYRVAVLRSSKMINSAIGHQLDQQFSDSIRIILSNEETEMVFGGRGEDLERLERLVNYINEQDDSEDLSVGISAEGTTPSLLSVLSRQARRAVPYEPGTSVFRDQPDEYAFSLWREEERLYHFVTEGAEEEAGKALQEIVSYLLRKKDPAVYQTTRIVLASAAEETGVSGVSEDMPQYQNGMSLSNGAQMLQNALARIFIQINEQKEAESKNLQKQILNYIFENLSDSELYATGVGEHFGIAEKQVYQTIRQNTGMSFKEYLTQLRMKKAGDLLYMSQKEVSDIAHECGYISSSTFYRHFQNYFGQAPGDFRKNGTWKTGGREWEAENRDSESTKKSFHSRVALSEVHDLESTL